MCRSLPPFAGLCGLQRARKGQRLSGGLQADDADRVLAKDRVHADETFRVDAVASAFGVEIGPIIGTNVFQQFFTTIDAPERRLIISQRGDPAARAAHIARLSGPARETPFALLGEHFMISRGRVCEDHDVNFIDSGLAFFRSDQGQAGLMFPPAHSRRGAFLRLPRDVSRRFPGRSRSALCTRTA